jgi:NAD(P)-dependent dehydrogenase (short-subunit alcohol dehydrogenase family)
MAFAEPGSTVAIAARTRTELDDTARAIGARGAGPIALVVDVTDANLVKFLASPQAAITGQAYNICGGQTMD